MADLHMDLKELDALYHDLVLVRTTFDQAAALSSLAGEAVGHEGLKDKLHHFESDWDDRRRNISTSLQVVAGTVHTIQKTFHEIDSKLKGALTPKQEASA
jgi:hypothetical protein